jgi:hypothetical protein
MNNKPTLITRLLYLMAMLVAVILLIEIICRLFWPGPHYHFTPFRRIGVDAGHEYEIRRTGLPEPIYSESIIRQRYDRDPEGIYQYSSLSFGDDYRFAGNRNRLRPNQVLKIASISKAHQDQVVFSHLAAIDHLGNRKTKSMGFPKYHFLIAGTSNVFGLGVEDPDTLSQQVANQIPGWQVHNLGKPADSPVQLLLDIRSRQYFPAAMPRDGVMAFMFLEEHLQRLLITQQWVMMSHSYNYPVLSRDDLRSLGPFKDQYLKATFYKALNSLQLVKSLGLSWPLYFNDNDFEFVAKIFSEISQGYRSHFGGNNKFVFVALPSISSEYQRISGALARDARFPSVKFLDRMGVNYLDYSDVLIDRYLSGPAFWNGDYHPTAQFNRWFGKKIVQDLKQSRVL